MTACTNTSPSHCSSRLKCENTSPISAPRPFREFFHAVLCRAQRRGKEKKNRTEKKKSEMQWLYGTGGGGWWRGPKSEPAIGGVFKIIFYISCFSPRTWRSGAASSNFPIFWLQFFYFPCRPFTVQYYSDSGYAIIYTPDHPEGVIVADPMGDCLPGEAKYRMHMSLTTRWLPCPTLIFHSPQVPAYRASLGMLPSCKNTVRQSIGRMFFS